MGRPVLNESDGERAPILIIDKDDQEQDEEGLDLPSTINVNKERGQAFGNKSLNFFYSLIFIINQIYGPGVLAIPIVFQQGGFVITTIVLGAFTIISSFSATLLCEALSMIPGNRTFDKHIEYTVAVKYYYGKKWYIMFQLFLNVTIQSYNIASIVICAQSLDQFLVQLFHKTYSVVFYPSFKFLETNNANELYGSAILGISLGYIIIMIICVPSGFLNLDDNVKVVQLFSFVMLVILLGEFIIQFIIMGTKPNGFNAIPAIGVQYAQVVSVFIFSWAYPMFIPSWVNEKKNDVSVNKVVWLSTVLSFLGYLGIGLLAACVFAGINTDNILATLANPGLYNMVTVVAAYVFSLGVIAPGIPVCCITTRYNLYIGQLCGKKMSYFLGVIAPWMIGFIFCQGQVFALLLAWSSLIFGSIINFVVPLMIYLKALKVKKQMLHHNYGDSVHYTHKSIVDPWPDFLKPKATLITKIMIFSVLIMVGFQVVWDLYFQIAKHQNLLG
eukprot:TRINITY_DN497_c0_g1_i1.p1 TRINITY_DN497_c0_g1~~TRINITY_DN497_c0_g1_i1.p1  ORF type:complete len:500 (+),score=75.63 TRINITY_DN497_c0_g1_i1:263-1762(+)